MALKAGLFDLIIDGLFPGILDVAPSKATVIWDPDISDPREQSGKPDPKSLAERERALNLVQTKAQDATPVPESFEQAIKWACVAALGAAKGGQMRQVMRFSMPSSEGEASEDTNDVSGTLGFSEGLVKSIAKEGVLVIVPDEGIAQACERDWAPLPPSVMLKSASNSRNLAKLADTSIVVAAAPDTREPFDDATMEWLYSLPDDVLLILVESSNASFAPNAILKKRGFATTFHMDSVQQLEFRNLGGGEDDPYGRTIGAINPAFVTRVWPRPFSVWEDDIENEAGFNGYFLLNISVDASGPSENDVQVLLETSRDRRKRLEQERLAAMELDKLRRERSS